MMTTKEAIAARRSIRKFKPDPVPEEQLTELLDAARLAPSGSNSQPWRFKIVTDAATKAALMAAAHQQKFIAAAPVVLVCCVDIQGYIDGSLSTIQELSASGDLPSGMVLEMRRRTEELRKSPRDEIAARVSFNIGIAGEHIALRALDFGLGTCWVRALDEKKIRELFHWGENLFVAALMPLGYPAESPQPRKRRTLPEILLD
jgi:nitroreductase